MEENKQMLMDKLRSLADKSKDIKEAIEKMLEELDNIKAEYIEIVKKIKGK